MATQLGDTLTSRDAFRRAVLDDLVGRADIEATPMEGGPLDGIKVVSIGKLRDLVLEHLQVELPPPTDKYAEVSTPATVATSTICPECKQPTEIVVKLHPRLTVEGNSTELAVKAKSKSVPHMHGQLPLGVPEGQETLEDAVGKIDDLRLRILRAVYDLLVEAGVADEKGEPAPPITLDAIAARLEIANESDRGDLEESLYGYSQTDPPLVKVISEKGSPVTYVLDTAGLDMVDVADAVEPLTGDGVEGEVVDEEAEVDDDKDGSS